MNSRIKVFTTFLAFFIIGLILTNTTYANTTSKIVFSDANSIIKTINPDGTDVNTIGTGQSPEISPDGTKIVYSAQTNNSTTSIQPLFGCHAIDIYVMNTDGTDIKNLTNLTNCEGAGYPSWSPDGTKILYSLNSTLHIMNADGSNDIDLGVNGTRAMWSPTGTKIAFVTIDNNGNTELYTMNSDGSNITDLGISNIQSVPSWSPDGSKIAYWLDIPSPAQLGVNIVNSDGTNAHSIVNAWSEAGIFSIGWSPDGSTLAFSGGIQLTSNSDVITGLFTVPATGGTPIRIYYDGNENDAYDSYVNWGNVQTNQNVPPTIGSVTVSPNPVQINSPTVATGSFTDPAGGSTDTASWNWGDGSSSSGTITESNGSGSVTDSHTYTTAGVYSVTLTVTNPMENLSTTQMYQYVSTYDVTSNGRFAGAKEFTSPAGAYTANTSLTGPIDFGLDYKYQGTLPRGDTQFTLNFPVANLMFNTDSVSSLVISGTTATLEGTGTINNGSQKYNFVVVGVDNGNIRVQITDPSNNNAVIYDTQPGDPLTAAPTAPITKGKGITVSN